MKNKIKNIAVALGGCFSFVVSLILLIKSFDTYDDGYGIDYSTNNNYVVALLLSTIVIVYAVYRFVLTKKEKSLESANAITVFSITLIGGAYNLGVFFKALGKAINKDIPFDFIKNQNYLYIGIVLALAALFFAFDVIEAYKNIDND